MLDRLFVYLQFILPRYWLTALVHRLARIRTPVVKDILIRSFVRLYEVDPSDVKLDIPGGFATFNDFFVRELEAGARPIDGASDALVSPVDGTISSIGMLRGNGIVQAKGIDYSIEELLATDIDDARAYLDGAYATIYLAPCNYHRVHAPIDGELVKACYVPGELFSVNAATAARLPGLFSRNERLVLHFRTAAGPAAAILVGAMNVGSISTPWSGEIRPRKRGMVESIDIAAGTASVGRGDPLGHFNMGSTVIILLPRERCRWRAELDAGKTVKMGERIATLTTFSQ
jgi:phosphatidylserine decarboxylase